MNKLVTSMGSTAKTMNTTMDLTSRFVCRWGIGARRMPIMQLFFMEPLLFLREMVCYIKESSVVPLLNPYRGCEHVLCEVKVSSSRNPVASFSCRTSHAPLLIANYFLFTFLCVCDWMRLDLVPWRLWRTVKYVVVAGQACWRWSGVPVEREDTLFPSLGGVRNA